MTESYSTMQDMPRAKTKSKSWVIVALAIVVTIVLIIFYKELFPQGYLKSHELEQNQAKWEGQHITHYRMSVNESGYAGSFAATVEVKDGNIISPVGTPSEREYLFTVPGLFSYVSKTYMENPPAIRVTYDSTLGYPTTIYIDPYREPCCQDFTIEIQDFQVLSP
jgi:uncharacterized protein DUF6174